MRRRIRGILMSGKQFSLDSRMDLVQVSKMKIIKKEKLLFSEEFKIVNFFKPFHIYLLTNKYIMKGYASCGRPSSEPTTNLPLMKEDDDTSGINESNNTLDKNDTTIGKKVSINNDEIHE